MNTRERKQWLYLIRQLRKNFSQTVPITVQTVNLKRAEGETSGVVKLRRLVAIRIRVRRTSCFACQWDALMHEWAHAMEWEAHEIEGSPKRDHGETWGVWYAKIYRHLVDDCWADMGKKGLLPSNQMELDW
jgi:hypothetical protein